MVSLPLIAGISWVGMNSFYLYSSMAPDADMKFYEKKFEPIEKFMWNWWCMSLFWTIAAVAANVWIKRNDAAALRRLAIFNSFNIVMVITGLLFSGNTQVDQGHISAKEQLPGHLVMFIGLIIQSAAMGSGDKEMMKPLRKLYAQSTPVGWALFLNYLLQAFWFYDVSALSGMGKYCVPGVKMTSIAIVIKNWECLNILASCFQFVYQLIYGTASDQKAFAWMAIGVSIAIEAAVRAGPLGAMFDADAMLEGTIMRVVMCVLLAGCAMATSSGNKTKSG